MLKDAREDNRENDAEHMRPVGLVFLDRCELLLTYLETVESINLTPLVLRKTLVPKNTHIMLASINHHPKLYVLAVVVIVCSGVDTEQIAFLQLGLTISYQFFRDLVLNSTV